MATHIIEHTTTAPQASDNTGSVILAVTLLLIFALFIIFGLPVIRGISQFGTPQVNIPDKVDVNVNK